MRALIMEPTEGFTFKQGVVVGLLMMAHLEREIDHCAQSGLDGIIDVVRIGANFQEAFERVFGKRSIPEFPAGIPEEVFEAVNEMMLLLMQENLV